MQGRCGRIPLGLDISHDYNSDRSALAAATWLLWGDIAPEGLKIPSMTISLPIHLRPSLDHLVMTVGRKDLHPVIQDCLLQEPGR